MCGIIGMVGVSAVNQRIYDALTVLQHRGQDAAGIMTSADGELFMRKDSGLVRDVFQQKHMLKLRGNVGIGHVRYPTAGADSATRSAMSASVRRASRRSSSMISRSVASSSGTETFTQESYRERQIGIGILRPCAH